MPHGIALLANKPIIITFLAMEKVFFSVCTFITTPMQDGSGKIYFFSIINSI